MSLRSFVKTDVERRRDNLATHELVKTGDPDATGAIVDSRGEVVLGYCRRCRGGEAQLEDESCLERLIKLAVEADAKRTPLERAMRALEGKFGYVATELTVNDQDEVVRTREEAVAIIERSSPEYVVWKELRRRIDAEEATANPDAKEPPRVAPGNDGSVRRAHYGDGKQPWDTAVEKGWAAKGAALMVIKYLRRNKGTPEKDTRDARWYYDRLVEMTRGNTNTEAMEVFVELTRELTVDEVHRVAVK